MPVKNKQAPTTSSNPNKLLTAKDLADQLSVTEQVIYRWVAQGRLPVLKAGRLQRFRQREVDAFLEEGRCN
jgi:excisionase family DNA binding protein